MFDADVFLTLAEVAVAFAGFASLVAILGEKSAEDDPRVLGVRMRAMLLASLIVVAFSLFPVVVGRFGAEPATIWAVANACLLIVTAAYLAWIAVVFRSLAREVGGPRRFQRVVILPVLALTFASLATVLVVNLFLASPALYLSALALLLLQAGFAFSLIVFSFLPRLGSSGPPPEGPTREA